MYSICTPKLNNLLESAKSFLLPLKDAVLAARQWPAGQSPSLSARDKHHFLEKYEVLSQPFCTPLNPNHLTTKQSKTYKTAPTMYFFILRNVEMLILFEFIKLFG